MQAGQALASMAGLGEEPCPRSVGREATGRLRILLRAAWVPALLSPGAGGIPSHPGRTCSCQHISKPRQDAGRGIWTPQCFTSKPTPFLRRRLGRRLMLYFILCILFKPM